MRERAGPQRVTHLELFFDLVYVFAVTQLSHFLLAGPEAGAARTGIEAAVLLIMVWQLWAYTTWVTNWLNPDLIAVRLLMLALAVISGRRRVARPARTAQTRGRRQPRRPLRPDLRSRTGLRWRGAGRSS